MATIPFDTIISILRNASNEVWTRRNDEEYWSGWLSDGGEGDLTVTKVAFQASGLTIEMTDEEGKKHSLKAVPGSASRTAVLYNGTKDPQARLVFDLKGTFTNPTRFAFDFRPVTVDGKEVRFNLRYDP